MPRPVTRPIRALISWIAHIRGQLKSNVQPRSYPNCAPAWEYVAIPLGSSSDAPVIKPSPSTSRSFGLTGCLIASGAGVRAGSWSSVVSAICVGSGRRSSTYPLTRLSVEILAGNDGDLGQLIDMAAAEHGCDRR